MTDHSKPMERKLDEMMRAPFCPEDFGLFGENVERAKHYAEALIHSRAAQPQAAIPTPIELLAESLAVLDLMLVGCSLQCFGDYQNGDGETIGPRMDALHEALRKNNFLAAPAIQAQLLTDAWISVEDRLPAVGLGVMVYAPPLAGEGPEDYRLDFDCIDPNDDDHASWLNHNEYYEHYCCIGKPEGSTGPKEKASYTHWMPLPAAPTEAEDTK